MFKASVRKDFVMGLLHFDFEHKARVIHSMLISEPPSAHEAFQGYLDPFSDVGRHVFEKNEKPVSRKIFTWIIRWEIRSDSNDSETWILMLRPSAVIVRNAISQ